MIELRIGELSSSMGLLEWSSQLASSLAWPVSAIIIASLFRRPISGLMGKVRKASWGDKSVDFDEVMEKIETEIALRQADEDPVGAPAVNIDDGKVSNDMQKFEALLRVSPAAAIIESWWPIEEKIISIYRKDSQRDLTKLEMLNAPRMAAHKLLSHGVISSEVFDNFNDLRMLRNMAIHDRDKVNVEEAKRFQAVAQVVGMELDKVLAAY